jgi:outer membrane protein TolC
MRRAALLFLAGVSLAGPAAQAQESGTTLTLDDAIQLALRRNRDLKVASYYPGIARANLLVARGQFDPSIVISQNATRALTDVSPGEYSNYHTDSYSATLQGQLPVGTQLSFTGNTTAVSDAFIGLPRTYDTYGGFSITQPLLKGFGLSANLVNVRIAKANRSINDLTYRQSAIDTVTNVVVAYSNLMLAHDQLDAAERERSLAVLLRTESEKRFTVGSASQSDVLTSRAYAAEYEEPILIAERGVRDAQNQLRSYIGEESFFEDEPLFTLAPMEIPEVTINRKADLERALAQRPDYQMQRLAILKNRASESYAANSLLPEVDLVGNYGYNGVAQNFSASRAIVDQRLNPSYGAGVAVTIPLAFAVGRGNLRSARLQREQSEAALNQLQANIALSVATAEGQVETTRKRVTADLVALDLAKQDLAAEEKKLKAGMSSTNYVVQKQQQLAQDETSLSNALAAERQAIATYDHELGATLERHHIKLADE